MKTITKIIACVVMLSMLTGCQNLYTGVITVTEIRHSVMNDLGEELRAGRIDAATWQKVVEYDNQYRAAARTARIALETYRDFGTGDPAAALQLVKNAVFELINVLAGYQSVEAQRNQLSNATKL